MDPIVGETVHFRAEMESRGRSVLAAIVTDVKPGGKVTLAVLPPMGSQRNYDDIPPGDAETPGTWFRPGQAAAPATPSQPEGGAAA